MNPKKLHNLTWGPISLIGLGSVGLGLSWLVSPQPWLLDKTANEALLQTTFQTLLAAPINRHLTDYMTLSYRFFGWWIISIGLLILAYTLVTRLGTALARNVIHIVLFIILSGMLWIELKYIPGSPYVLLGGGLWILWAISAWASRRLKQFD